MHFPEIRITKIISIVVLFWEKVSHDDDQKVGLLDYNDCRAMKIALKS